MDEIINFEYSCIHGSYWMFNGVAASFTTVFLLAAGYSNSEIGLFLAVANILAIATYASAAGAVIIFSTINRVS